MMRIYLTAVDIVPAAIVLVPLFLILYCTAYKRELRKSILYCVFCLYLSAVFSLVGIPNVTYFRPSLNLNLIPFRGIAEDLKNSILNIVLFVPLGFLLPTLWDEFRQLRSSVMAGFYLSLSIELLQTLTYRATDVNDLITNVFGTLVGFLLAKPLNGKRPIAGYRGRDAYALCGLSFGIMFLLHPLLNPLIWDWFL